MVDASLGGRNPVGDVDLDGVLSISLSEDMLPDDVPLTIVNCPVLLVLTRLM